MKARKKLKNVKNCRITKTRSITKSSDGYNKKYMKIKFHSDDKLPLKKTIEVPSMIIVGFHENNKYYPQIFLDECLYKL